MAGKVKKGFGTYLFLLLLTIIAAFLIVLLVMLFNPFKKIMGYQYFYYDDVLYEYNVTGGTTEEIFDLSAMEEIKVNCNYANVKVYKTSEVENNAIKIENRTKGFAKANADVDFTYKIYYEEGSSNKVLCVDVDEVSGSLYFSRKVAVSILIPEESPSTLTGTVVDIANTSGDVYIGYGSADEGQFQVEGINVKTKSGDIKLGPVLSTGMKDVFIKSDKGNIKAINDIVATNSFNVNSKSGKVSFKNLTLNGSANLILDSSEFFAQSITGNVDLEIYDGYFDVDKLSGTISGNNAAEQMSSARINIGEVNGNVSFPFANKAKIKISKMTEGSKLYVHGTSGSVTVGELRGYGWIEMTSGKVDVTTYSGLEVKTTKGDINVSYQGDSLANTLDITSQKGDVDLKVKESLAFILNVFNAKGALRDSYDISIEGFGTAFTFPLTINGGTNPINITTNADVNVSFN